MLNSGDWYFSGRVGLDLCDVRILERYSSSGLPTAHFEGEVIGLWQPFLYRLLYVT
jgi:hypothetical protein